MADRLSKRGKGITYPFDALMILCGAGGGLLWTLPASPADAQEVSSTVLPTLSVNGEGETARGPVKGYVATRSGTATKTDTPIMETPQSVTVVTRDQMDAQNAQTISQVLRYVAGVNSDPFGADTRADWFYIRGFQPDIYLDGLRVPQITNRIGGFGAFRVEPFSLERAEVLKGGTSVLYGAGNVGGLVNLVSKEPTRDSHGLFGLQYGTYGRVQGNFDLSGSLNKSGTLMYRLDGIYRSSGTQVGNIKDDRVSVNPTITWQPDADTRLTLYGTYLHDNAGSAATYGTAQGMVLPNRNGRIPTDLNTGDPGFDKYEKVEYSAGYRFQKRFNNVVTVRSNFRWTYMDTDNRTVYGAASQPRFVIDQRTLARQSLQVQPILSGIQLDNHAQFDFSTGSIRHKALAGVDYQYQLYQNRTWSGTAPSIDLFRPVYYQQGIMLPARPGTSINQDQEQIGLYAQDQIRWRRLILLAGIREDITNSTTYNNNTKLSTTQNPSKFTYRFGLMYEAPHGFAPYASYATSFLPTLSNTFGQVLKPTTGQQWEVGVKYEPPGLPAMLTVAAFNLTQQNVSRPDPNNVLNTVQTGEIRSRGIEVEGRVSLTAHLNAIGTFTYQDVQNTKGTAANQNKRPFGVPNHMASAWLDYTYPVSSKLNVGIGGGVRYNGNTAGDDANSFLVPSYVLFDAVAHADYDRWRLQVNAYNMFDRTYVAGCNTLYQCYYGLRRTVLANLTYRW